ncbi:MAG: hypothetical protein WBW81_08725 [Methylocella sp.]
MGLIANVRTEPRNDSHTVWSEIFNGQKIFKSGDEWPIEPHGRAPAYPVGQPIGEPSRLLIVHITYSDVFDYMHVSEFTFFESEGSFYAISGKEYNRNASAKAPDKWTPAWSNNLLNEQVNRASLPESP